MTGTHGLSGRTSRRKNSGFALLLVVLLALNELTISALLWSSGAETLGVAVFNLEQGGESAAAAAIGIVSVAVANSIMLLASIAGRRLPSGVLPWRA